MTPHRTDQRVHAFTLVELLVVIGIIALLISILLPSLNGARRAAATVKCLSAMRQIGAFYQLYAGENKGLFPVTRMDVPQVGPDKTNQSGGKNLYWTDFLMKYASKSGAMNYQTTGTAAQQAEQFEAARRSVLWGCPQWEGWYTTTAANKITTSQYTRWENGFTPNLYPGIQPTDKATVLPSNATMNYWSSAMTGAGDGNAPAGTIYKVGKISRASERMLLCDANLWTLLMNPTDANWTLAPQNATRTVKAGAGATQIDRYRHGRYPEKLITDNGQLSFAPNGGQVKFNVLFYDGHASTLTDYKQGWATIWMRYPG